MGPEVIFSADNETDNRRLRVVADRTQFTVWLECVRCDPPHAESITFPNGALVPLAACLLNHFVVANGRIETGPRKDG